MMLGKPFCKLAWCAVFAATGVLLFSRTAGAANVRYVDPTGNGTNGLTWQTAFRTVQEGVNALSGGEVWVAAAVYTSGGGTLVAMKKGVHVYGGFSGWRDGRGVKETSRFQRDWINNRTVLDGNGSGPVVVGASDATFDGFTIQNGSIKGYGAGMSIPSWSSSVVKNCVFKNNAATCSGGGMCISDGASTIVANCIFIGNTAAFGGGMANAVNSKPVVMNCIFSGNLVLDISESGGGGMFSYPNVSATITNCTFSGNGNSGTKIGGGIYTYGDPSTIGISNCIFWGNIARMRPNIASYMYAPEIQKGVAYSNVQGGYAGHGNINADPLFVDADGPDNVFGTLDDNLRLQAGSPCIDVGSNVALPPDTPDLDNDANTTEPIPYDLDNGLRIVASTVDMGAYEGKAVRGRR